MNATKQAAWLFCALIAIGYSALYFSSSTQINKLDKEMLSVTVDSVITNLTVRQFDTTGKIAHFFEAPLIEHIPKNDTHFVQFPHIVIAQSKQPAWEIVANKATALKRGQKITFTEKVVVHQNQSGQSQESTFRTEKLIYFSKSKLASTDLAIIFEQPGRVVQSQGMKAYLNEKRVQLLSKARATYEPNKNV